MKISVVIPSRERGNYLKHSLATVTSIKDDNLEIVISDNASTDDTKAVVENSGDPRVRYVRTFARLSMRKNFEFALRASTGDYVIMIGDDDGIVPGHFKYLRQMLEQHSPDVLSWDLMTYWWPAEGVRKGGSVHLVRDRCFGRPEPLDATARLRSLEHGDFDGNLPIPRLYHGCMSREYLDRLRAGATDYFRSFSPDLYISFRALQHGGNFLYCRHPLTVHGFSPASTGGAMQSLGSKTEDKADLRFLTELKTDQIGDVIPVSKSMALAFLGTLQTLQVHYPSEPIRPNYVRWYQHALADQYKKNASVAAEIAKSLDANAEQFGTKAALKRARAGSSKLRFDKAKASFSKLRQKRHSFRVSTEINGENTIDTAVRTCDMLLGDELGVILKGQRTRADAWLQTRKRLQKNKK